MLKYTPSVSGQTKMQYEIYNMDNKYMYSTFDGKIAAGEHHMGNNVKNITVDFTKKHPNKTYNLEIFS